MRLTSFMIDEELFVDFKIALAHRQETMREVLTDFIEKYINHYKEEQQCKEEK